MLGDAELDDLMRGELLVLPSELYLAEQLPVADPGAINAAREGLKAWLGRELREPLLALHERAAALPYGRSPAAKGARKVKTQALVLLAAADPREAADRAAAQYRAADNMTDRQGALSVLCGLDVPERVDMLDHFHKRYQGNALVIDKWFSLQAGSLHPKALEQVRLLAGHPDFTLNNPNRVRALYAAFAMNQQAFHRARRRRLPPDRRPDPRARPDQCPDRGAAGAAAGPVAADRAGSVGADEGRARADRRCPRPVARYPRASEQEPWLSPSRSSGRRCWRACPTASSGGAAASRKARWRG